MTETIISPQNEKIKQLVKLNKHRVRQKNGLTIIDGEREIKMALANHWPLQEIFYCPELIKNQDLLTTKTILIPVSLKIFSLISQKENPDGYLAVAKIKNTALEDLKLKPNPLLIILETVEKPGNLGAIIRTAAAGNIDAVIIADEQTDIYHPSVIRASQGNVFKIQTASASTAAIMAWLKKNKIKSYAASTKAAKNYQEIDWQKASAIVLGTEAEGLSDQWLTGADAAIKIPMQADLDSLNVSVSAAIIAYEALRQRDFVDIDA